MLSAQSCTFVNILILPRIKVCNVVLIREQIALADGLKLFIEDIYEIPMEQMNGKTLQEQGLGFRLHL